MKTRRVLAFDLGASGGKCFVGTFENKSLSIEEIHRFTHEGVTFHMADQSGKLVERAYWDDILLYQNIINGLHAYRRNVADKVDSIGIDTWGADGHFFDANGDMLGKIYTYRDHRLDKMSDMVKRKAGARRIYEITGICFWPFNISNQLCWFVQNRPDLLDLCHRFAPIPSLFYFYLSGVNKVDTTWASITQLMDARTKRWSREILRKLGIPIKIMPEIVKPGAILGRLLKPLAEAVGINQTKLIAVGSHDTASAFAAAPVEKPANALIISSGTWSLIGKLIREPITTPEAMDAAFSSQAGVSNTQFIKNCMGTWLAQELRRVWRIADGRETQWDELTKLAASARPFAAFIDPDDISFYNPANMETAIADFCKRTGQVPPTDRGSMLRTVYESLALKYRMVNEALCKVTGSKNTVVHIVGGGCRNKMLNQFTADALGLPVVAGPEEATAVGNIMAQAMGLGIIRSMKEALPIIRSAFRPKEYRPRETERWNTAYKTFVTLQSTSRC